MNLKRMLDVLEVVASDDGKMDVGQSLVAAILNKGAEGLPQAHLINISRNYKALSKEKRQELLEKLVDDGEIKLNVKIKQSSGQITNRVVHSSFINKQTS